MADDKRKAPGTADAARHRQPPTIDLTAKDVTDEPPASAPADAPGGAKAEASERRAPPKTEPKPEAKSAGAPGRQSVAVPALLAGLGGGALVAAAAAVLWLSGALTPSPPRIADDSALRARLDALDKKLGDLAARPQPVADNAASNRAIADIAARLGKIEQTIERSASTSPVIASADLEKLTAIDTNLKALGVAVAGLNRRVDEIAANALAAREESGTTAKSLGELRKTLEQAPSPAGRADVEALAKRLDGIEAAAKSANQSTAQATSIGAAVRLALTASALREAVGSGGAYVAELAAVKAAGGEAAAITALEPLATKGVPSDAALAKELLGLIAPIAKAAGVDKQTSGGFLEKLQANAEKLVRVRPLDEPAGADTAAIIARIEARAARNDVAGARSEVEKLPRAAKQVAGSWLKTFAARDAARAAARTLVADATRALAQP
ncbi:MAG: COG4223 family protein [Pseudolabrys sp.]